MSFDRVIAIGTSAGGVTALKKILENLPADFPAPIFIVIHLQSDTTSNLPQIINRYSQLVALHPTDGQNFKAGFIYIAPPGRHMIIAGDKIYLRYGPKVNYVIPAIDTLFYSIASNYGSAAVGVVLTGLLSDGTAGLLAIKKNRGTTIIQDLDEAEYPEMPRNALKNVSIDYCLPLLNIAILLIKLAKQHS